MRRLLWNRWRIWRTWTWRWVPFFMLLTSLAHFSSFLSDYFFFLCFREGEEDDESEESEDEDYESELRLRLNMKVQTFFYVLDSLLAWIRHIFTNALSCRIYNKGLQFSVLAFLLQFRPLLYVPQRFLHSFSSQLLLHLHFF